MLLHIISPNTTSMATNKFATMLQKSSHKIIVILVYAVLEWILILLLLLNSLLSYLIQKFANYYGLKPPCTLCSRLDHIFESKNHASSDLDCVCEAHGREISKLSYCCNHQRLGEFKNLCCDCSNSRPAHDEEVNEISPSVAFFTWAGDSSTENGEENRCCCCDEILSKKPSPSSLLFKPSWDVLDYIQKKGCVVEVIDEERNVEEASDTVSQNKTESSAGQLNHETECEESNRDGNGDQGALKNENQLHSDVKFEANLDGTRCENMGILEAQNWESSRDYSNRSTNYLFQSQVDDESLYIADMLLQNAEYVDSDKFICIELIDLDTIVGQDSLTNSSEKIEEGEEKGAMTVHESKDYSEEAALQRMKISEMDTTDCFSTQTEENKTRDQEVEQYKQFIADIATVTQSDDSNNAEEAGFEVMDSFQDSKDKDSNLLSIEAKSVIAMGKEAMCFEQDHCAQFAETTMLPHYSEIAEQLEDEHSSEEMMADGLKKRITLEKRELGMEDFLNGSVFDEMEIDSDSLTAEHLKTTIKAQSKALGELYAELEEERKAAAVAAKETMAMITKLQEEKAAMQMEALQYQRMMEEQAEYDQEALQLLNDLMIKREKEKQELEKELEMYRHMDLDCESREKRMTSRRSTNGSDDYSIDNGCEREFGDGDSAMHREHSIKNINDAALKHLEEMGLEQISDLSMPDISLAEFDEERLSILEQLKNLEAKLFALHNDEQQLSEDINSVEHNTNSYTKEFNQSYNIFSSEEKGALDTLSNDHVISKKLLPLFDATDQEFGEGEFDRKEISGHSIELEKSKLFIQGEFSHVYERLQALEADKEFLKHCIQSMMKGNKGIFLLQEILQHLRDLKSVELCASNLAELPIADVSLHDEDEE